MANDDAPGPVWIPGARLAGFIKKTTLSSGPFGFKEEDLFYVCSIVSLWELMTPGDEPFLTPGACLAGFM